MKTIERWTEKARRRAWALGIGAVLAFLIARPLLAADIGGTWEISYWVGSDLQAITLELVQDGRTVSGMGAATIVGATTDSVRLEVRSGVLRGADFRFSIIEVDVVDSRRQDFSGSWYRDEMSGRTDGAFGGRMFTGARRLRR